MDPRDVPAPSGQQGEPQPDPKTDAVDEIIGSVLVILEDETDERTRRRGRKAWRRLGWWR